MNNPLEITFHEIPHSKKIEAIIEEKLEKIKKLSDNIIKCHVILDKQSQHHQKGNAYSVRLDLKIGSFNDIIISADSKEGELPLAAAVRDVFKKAHELVREQIAKHREKTTRPEEKVMAQSDLVPEDDEDEYDLD